MPQKTEAECIAFWEKLFPGRGQALGGVIGRFSGFQPDFSILPRDIEQRVKERRVIFWRGISGVIHVPDPVQAISCLKEHIGHSLEARFDQDATKSLSAHDNALLEQHILDEIGPRAGLLGVGFLILLFYSCSFIVTGRPERALQLKPLLDLWFEGIHPLGFDQEDRLVIMGRSDQIN